MSCSQVSINRCRSSSSKSVQRKLDEKIPVPSFLEDPSNRMKVVDKHILINVKTRKFECTKADGLLLKKDLVYTTKKNRN